MSAFNTGEIQFSGFLTKEGSKVKSWKKRFFVLDDNGLTYYKDQDKQQLLDTIPQAAFNSVSDYSKRKFGFELNSTNRSLKLAADNQDLKEQWMKMIRAVIQQESLFRRERISSLEKELSIYKEVEHKIQESVKTYLKQKYEKKLAEKDKTIATLKERIKELEEKNSE